MSIPSTKTDRLDVDRQITQILDGKILAENEIKSLCEKVNSL
jgi:hypothetical protein